jgi:metallo-beta-lactamase family protein
MIDCGLFQGLKKLRLRNWERLPVNPANIDLIILTHAHLDHCGYIPMLVKNGFKGKIYMTPPTKELAEVILRDSAKIQEEDAEKANRGRYSKHHPPLPLYTLEDAERCFRNFVTVDDDVKVQVSAHISFRFFKNGHILGSCFVDMNCYGRKIVFSGDIGRYRSAYLAAPVQVKAADFLFMESTYGDRLHDTKEPALQLANVILETYQHRGNVLIPAFAVGRAQEMMKILSDLKQAKVLPPKMAIYMDSPMAADATDILYRYPEWHTLSKEECLTFTSDIVINREFERTLEIVADPRPKIIIAASGMLTGGRILEYMKNYATHKNNAILLAGYQVEGTRGRTLLEGGREIKIHGRYIQVKAQVHEISGLSAHGDQGEMLQWIKGFDKKPQKIFLVHGELNSMQVFKDKIMQDLDIDTQIMPAEGEVELFKVE